MADERTELGTGEMVRWTILAVLVAVGLVLYFALGVDAPVLLRPTGLETPP
jgi:hypothetical protein